MTAEEMIKNRYHIEDVNEVALRGERVVEIMNDFAKYHCRKQLEAILEKADLDIFDGNEEPEDQMYVDTIFSQGHITINVNKESIEKAYSLTNIK